MRVIIAAVVALGLAASPGSARTIASDVAKFAKVHDKSSPPYGYVQFCIARPKHCKGDGKTSSRVRATKARLSELDFVNRQVNEAIEPIEDSKQYGVEEFWTIPTSGKGDCEEYVLVKRERLIKRNWPTGALLITVVLDENRQGHAVLTARTSAGDLILDNKHDKIKLWSKTPYTYIMRQSYLDPNVWLSLAPTSAGAGSNTAGTNTDPWTARIKR